MTTPKADKTGQEPKKKPPLTNNYAKYSGMAMQMMAIIVIGVLAGRKIDQWAATKYPVFTLVLTLLSVFAAMYYFIKDVIKKK